MFIDRVVVNIAAGDGGSGCQSFRREFRVPLGGPDGGDGGRGGDVIVRGDSNLTTLLDYTYKDSWKAGRGENGSGRNKSGRGGDDIIMPVPPGTVIRDSDTNELLADITENGQEIIIAKGGMGGKGNSFFASATQQAPRHIQTGTEGEVRSIILELKLIADIGLVGQPNAGKSTLLATVSAAHPKIADYPFTTLAPNLGVVQLSDHRTFVIADIPGIIEGAHEGKGLGLQFLRHIERTRVLGFMISIDSMDWQEEYDQLRREVSEYSKELAAKPHFVVFTKLDLLGELYIPPIEAPDALKIMAISSATREGIDELIDAWWRQLLSMKKESAKKSEAIPLP